MKTSLLSTFIAGLLLILSPPLTAADLAGSKDNPYLKRFDGSEIVTYKEKNYDRLNFYEKDDLTKPTEIEGKLIRIGYRVPPASQPSSLEVYRNYEDELKSKGFQIVNSGALSDLKFDGSFLATVMQEGGFAPGFYPGSVQNVYEISAVKPDPTGDIHLRVITMEATGAQFGMQPGDVGIVVDTVRVKGVTNKMVDGTADDMSKQLASTGSVNLYGIYFDTDKTDIKPESKGTLDEVGKLMSGDASLKLKVVGHTDNVGSADHNNDLSLRRAQSVVQALTTTYSVDSSRLTPSGAGSTQPVASNDTDDGRAKNRRVELVKL